MKILIIGKRVFRGSWSNVISFKSTSGIRNRSHARLALREAKARVFELIFENEFGMIVREAVIVRTISNLPLLVKTN